MSRMNLTCVSNSRGRSHFAELAYVRRHDKYCIAAYYFLRLFSHCEERQKLDQLDDAILLSVSWRQVHSSADLCVLNR